LKLSSPVLAAAAAIALTAAITLAQSPAGQSPQAGGPPPPRTFPAPTNLKVLPKNLTGQQVRDIMEGWEGELGSHCNTCHTANPNDIGPNGRPRLNFADDTKPEKSTARLMFKMTEDINQNYVSMVESAQTKVSCGTCHRGHIKPEEFVPPPEEHGPPRPAQPPPLPR
jgi:hypothetical protein